MPRNGGTLGSFGEESSVTIITSVGLQIQKSRQQSFNSVSQVRPPDFQTTAVWAFVQPHDDHPQ
jgi:hypothetical protein